MSFLAVLLALATERALGWLELEHWRRPHWFAGYMRWLVPRLASHPLARRAGLLLGGALAPALLAWLLDNSLDSVWRVWSFLFSTAVLAFMLGPRDVAAEINDYCDAVRNERGTEVAAIAERILGVAPPADALDRNRAVTEAALVNANDRLFGVLLWFLLLGPGGAVLFRCADLLRHALDDDEDARLRLVVLRLHGVLAWLPARLTAMGYALAGSFEEAVSDWRSYYHECSPHFFEVNNDVLACSGTGALRLAAGGDEGLGMVRATVGLIQRNLFIWLTGIALFTLIGWI
ncbi:MAG: regulatory signaling modulator protein AmpE [Gammaproteobacteria bacterium]|jgi:membrane protein required for beta-lactamase induction